MLFDWGARYPLMMGTSLFFFYFLSLIPFIFLYCSLCLSAVGPWFCLLCFVCLLVFFVSSLWLFCFRPPSCSHCFLLCSICVSIVPHRLCFFFYCFLFVVLIGFSLSFLWFLFVFVLLFSPCVSNVFYCFLCVSMVFALVFYCCLLAFSIVPLCSPIELPFLLF